MNERHAEVQQLVYEALETANAMLPPEATLAAALDTLIVADGTTLDSLGIINVVLAIEEHCQQEGHAIELFDESLIVDPEGPFRTVATIVDHIITLNR